MADVTTTNVLQKIKDRLNTPGPLLQEWADILLASTRSNFDSQTDPNGRPWTPLSPSTWKRANPNPDEILIDYGTLKDSIDAQFEAMEVHVGPSQQLDYEIIQHKGGSTGPRFPNTIPARPYVGVSEQDVLDIREAYMNYWFGGL